MRYILLLTLFLSWSFGFAQVPAKPQTKVVVISGATAHIGNGQIVVNSVLVIEKGEISFIGDQTDFQVAGAEVTQINATGKHIYPGFIVPNSILGLVEIGAVRATRDYDDVGAINPHVRSLISYNTDSKITPTVRSNGILMAQITPRGGLISGTSSIFNLDGWNWEDAVLKQDDAIWMNWPSLYQKTGWWGNPGPTLKNKNMKRISKKWSNSFSEAKAYSEAEFANQDLRFEAMRGLFDGSKKLFINANFAKEITDAVLFAKQAGVKEIVIVGGLDSWKVGEFLKENEVPVVLQRLYELPEHRDDDIDLPYKLPKLLKDQGVLFCLNFAGDMEAMGTRNLPFSAGTAAAYGLTKEEALQSITLNTAKILGIDKKVGSLEVGKEATLFISSGDALDMRTNNVEVAFIQGRKLDLTDHHKELYEKYSTKYGLK